jgi:hypothetical protein
MLKMTNRLLQWLPSVPKPLSGLFRHLNRSKNEEVRPPGSLPLQLCCLWFYNSHPSLSKPGSHALLSVKTQSRTQPRTGTNRRTVKVPLAPNRLDTWAYGHMTKSWAKKWLICLKTVETTTTNTRAHIHGSYNGYGLINMVICAHI